MAGAPIVHVDSLPRLNGWTVAFVPAGEVDRQSWWQSRLDAAHRHCFAFRAAPGGITQVVNHVGTAMTVELAPVDAAAAARRFAAKGIRMLAAPAVTGEPRASLRPAMTCVEVVKALIGMRDWRVWTPRQLAERMMRSGAAVVVVPEPVKGAR
jgi:hypothetical protein